MLPAHTRLRLFIVLMLTFALALSAITRAQPPDPSPATPDQCADVVYLMERDITPYEMSLSGGTLRAGAPTTSTLGAGAYADFWSFSLTRPRNANNILQDLTLTIGFSNVSGTPIEAALFNGIAPVIGYQPITTDTQLTYRPSAESGAYTLVIRKIALSDESAANYTLVATTTPEAGMSEQVVLSVRDESNNQPFAPAPQLSNGVMRVDATAATLFIHPDGTRRVHPRGGNATQVFMPNDRLDFSAHTLNIGNWANKLAYLGGDLGASGANRTYFIQNFDFRISVSGTTPADLNLQNITYGDGTTVRTDWAEVAGLWVMTDCTGVKLRDGRTFIATTARTGREVRAEGNLDAFTLITNAPTQSGTSARHSALIDWQNVPDRASIRLQNGIYTFPFIHDRTLAFASTDFRMTTRPNDLPDHPRITQLTLTDQTAEVTLDWVNLRALRLADAELTFDFLDAPRTTTTRPATNLARLEALEDVIHVVYKDSAGIPGEQRLLLPASDSYLEIITPAGLPAFSGTALAGETGYLPRALNNSGGECYPTNTTLPQANCPPAGDINPANGNLWLTIDDHTAFGNLLDLALIRNYNSRYASMDSPFGWGWTTNFLLDYAVPYNEATHSRPVDPLAVRLFNIGLDVTYAPRGLAVMTTHSGSRHQFVGDALQMRALTMPGWVLRRDSVRDATWRMTQDDGMTYVFDRAGRLLRYGYPDYGRIITIDYPRTSLQGAAGIGTDTAVIITDSTGDFALRRLELYYDQNHHIIQSILRDMTLGADETTCTLADNCFITTYRYNDAGYLVGVTYADGSTATYGYDEAGRMDFHDDPRAPLAQIRKFGYDERGQLTTAQAVDETNTAHTTHRLVISERADRRVVQVTDRLNNTRTYTYALSAGDLRAVGNGFTLLSETSPLAGTGDRLEDVPITYRWGSEQNPLLAGFLTRIEARGVGANQGRASLDFNYTPNGQLQCVACAFQSLPRLEVGYDQPLERRANRYLPTRITYANGTSEQFSYDANGLLVRYSDADGADYALTWSATAPFLLARMVRANDGMTWEFLYNPVGLVVNVVQATPNDPAPYQVGYQWDGLGRLIAVNDSVLGRYVIDYYTTLASDDAPPSTHIHLTDPLGSVTISTFNARGQLIGTQVHGTQAPLRHTAVAYDVYGRVMQVTEFITDPNTPQDAPLPYITRYDYVPTDSYVAPDGTPIPVRGEALVITDPYGRASTTLTDALGRVRRTIAPNGLINDFAYGSQLEGVGNFGQRIVQRTALLGTPFVMSAEYAFDIRRQLRSVQTASAPAPTLAPSIRTWTINAFADTARQRSMTTTVDNRTATWREMVWGDYVAGRPPSVTTSMVNIPLASGVNIEAEHRPTLGVRYDFLGRPLSIADGDSPLAIAYCPLSGGATETRYGTTSCADDAVYRLRLRYDVHGRLVEAQDDTALRRMSYVPNREQGVWEVAVQFIDPDGQTVASWRLHFNPLGEVVRWIDQDATYTHDYAYDTRGRLVAVLVADMPEKTTFFAYNPADQLVEQRDGLGRGFLYRYDALGRVVSKVDLRTADTLSYAYTPLGLLSTVVTSDGSTTIYAYEDRADPTRLTRIIEPSGAQHRFEWSDLNTEQPRLTNTLIYIDPFGNRTEYRYDASGLLWRIDLPDGTASGRRTHEVHYSDGGRITAWIRGILNANSASQRLTLARQDASTWQLTDSTPNGTGWTTQLRFAPDGRLLTANETTFAYDSVGRLVRASLPNGTAWTLAYDLGSVRLTDPFVGVTVLRYDALYRQLAQSRNNTTLTTAYTVGEGNTAVVRISHPTYGEREYTFSPGNARTGTPPSVYLRGHGSEVAYQYDGEGRLVSITTRICTDVEYDTLFECLRDDIPLWETRATLTYNAMGLPIRISDVDGNLETFAYDNMGRLSAYQNANGRNITYTYDSAGRLLTVVTATGTKLLMQYDPTDNLTAVCKTRASASNVFAECEASGGVLERYRYDTLGRQIAVEYPNGTNGSGRIAYAYDAQGNLISAGQVQYAYRGGGLLETMTVGNGESYAITYAALNRLATLGDLTFTYHSDDSLLRQTDDVTNFAFVYDVQNGIFSQTEGTNSLTYVVDEGGYLAGLVFNQTPLLATEFLFQQGNVDVVWDDETLVAYTLNNATQTQSLLMSGGNDMSIYYEVSGSGAIRRQNVILPFADGGYVAIYGYDNDERPITLRITDFAGLSVLFSQAITYRADGLRDSETWQYADGTQVITQYAYANNSQLASRVVTLRAQNTVQTQRFVYRYDAQGNLQTILEETSNAVCATFAYDDANRLISLTTADGETLTLRYDATHRLVRAGDIRISYRAGSDAVLALVVNGQAQYVGQLHNQPPQFLVGRGGDVTWLLNDGRNRIVQAYASTSPAPEDIWVFDAFGRYLTLDAPNIPTCGEITRLPQGLSPNLRLQPLADGALWLPQAGIYLQGGRAYEAETGMFMQRHFMGLDALGNAYGTLDQPMLVQPHTQGNASYQHGLVLLHQSQMQGQMSQSLHARAVLDAYLPQVPRGLDDLFNTDYNARAGFDGLMQRLYLLPTWLETAYNAPNGFVDENGFLRVPLFDTPGHGGQGGAGMVALPTPLPDWRGAMLGGIQPPQQVLQGMMTHAQPTVAQGVATYDPRGWRGAHVHIRQTWVAVHPQPTATPGDVLAWLPTPLSAPENGVYALHMAHHLQDITHTTPLQWLQAGLANGLPSAPSLPPRDLRAWRMGYFVQGGVGMRPPDPMPALPTLPRFPLGLSDDWLFVTP